MVLYNLDLCKSSKIFAHEKDELALPMYLHYFNLLMSVMALFESEFLPAGGLNNLLTPHGV